MKLADCASLRAPLLAQCDALGITGTLLLAEEGINGTIAGTRSGIDNMLSYLRSDPRLADLEHKESSADQPPFYRMKVKLKKEIVTMGVPGIDPTELVGHYVKPEDWNALISDPDVLLVDTRNDYEVEVGTFKGAVDPRITTFREFPEYVKTHFDPQKKAARRDVLHRRDTLRKSFGLHAATGFPRGLPSAGRDTEISGECARRKKACGRASASCSTSASRSGKAWRRGITNCATAARARSLRNKKPRPDIRRAFPARIVLMP